MAVGMNGAPDLYEAQLLGAAGAEKLAREAGAGDPEHGVTESGPDQAAGGELDDVLEVGLGVRADVDCGKGVQQKHDAGEADGSSEQSAGDLRPVDAGERDHAAAVQEDGQRDGMDKDGEV